MVISKPKWFAHSIIWLAFASGLFIGGRAGVALSVLCFTVGLGLLGTHLNVLKKGNPTQQANAAAEQATEILVTVKEAHAYSRSGQNPQHVADPQTSRQRRWNFPSRILSRSQMWAR